LPPKSHFEGISGKLIIEMNLPPGREIENHISEFLVIFQLAVT
jgi:hypothetical protein